MPEQKVEIRGVSEIKTTTAIKRIMDKGEEISRELVTKVTFEGDIDPADIAQIHRLLKSGAPVNISMSSPQLSMKLAGE